MSFIWGDHVTSDDPFNDFDVFCTCTPFTFTAGSWNCAADLHKDVKILSYGENAPVAPSLRMGL